MVSAEKFGQSLILIAQMLTQQFLILHLICLIITAPKSVIAQSFMYTEETDEITDKWLFFQGYLFFKY